MTSRAASRTLPHLERRLGERRLGLESAVLAALLVAMVPALVLASLERSLPALTVVVAVPAAAEDGMTREVERVLADAAVRRHLVRADSELTDRLWAALGPADAAPTLIEATLWPAAAIDGDTLEARLRAVVPAAAIDRRPEPVGAPYLAAAAAVLLALLALGARWRLARSLRRLLRAERTTVVLVRRFGASRAWIAERLLAPVSRRIRRGAMVGAALGALAGGAAATALEPALFRPWSGVATTVAAGTVVAAVLAVAWLAGTAAGALRRRLDALAETAP